jgi:hypothetical protein
MASTNSGRFSGAMAILEECLGKACHHWFCTLHLNELPFRHLVRHYFGGTTSPEGLPTEIGKVFKNLKSSTISARYKTIPNPDFPSITDKVLADLSHEQKNLRRCCDAVMTGVCPPDLAEMRLPGANGSRWVTTAVLFLFYFMTFETPPQNVFRVVYFIVMIYAPLWFRFKSHHLVTDAPRIFFDAMKVGSRIRLMALKIFQATGCSRWSQMQNFLKTSFCLLQLLVELKQCMGTGCHGDFSDTKNTLSLDQRFYETIISGA